MGVNSEVAKDILDKYNAKEKVSSCNNNKDHTKCNVVIKSEVVTVILDNDNVKE